MYMYLHIYMAPLLAEGKDASGTEPQLVCTAELGNGRVVAQTETAHNTN